MLHGPWHAAWTARRAGPTRACVRDATTLDQPTLDRALCHQPTTRPLITPCPTHAPQPPPLTHPQDYINFIRAATPNHSHEFMQQLKRFNMGAPGESDCPVFDGMYDYFAVSKLLGR